jgi:hypothetical protein
MGGATVRCSEVEACFKPQSLSGRRELALGPSALREAEQSFPVRRSGAGVLEEASIRYPRAAPALAKAGAGIQ